MINPDQIKKLSFERLQEASILCDNGKYDGAFYLAGYSIELMLKAKICEHWAVPGLFDNQYQTQGIREIRKAVKTHDITVLFIFSGLKTKFESAKGLDKILMQTYSRLFETSGRCIWSEQIRYQPYGTQNPENIQELMALLQHAEGILQWIESN